MRFANVGIDLGTSSVLVHMRKHGVVLTEPSVVALTRESGEVLAVGAEAKAMLGRTPDRIAVVRPMRDGVIADYEVTASMMRYFMEKVFGRRRFFKPNVVVCVPSGATETEKRSVIAATEAAGARRVRLMEEPMAAALGAGLNIWEPGGCMVVDIGGGTTDIAVISAGTILSGETLRVAGDACDEAIVDKIKRRHNLLIGEVTAQTLKTTLGRAILDTSTVSMAVSGRSVLYGLPRRIQVDSDEICEALGDPLNAIVAAISRVLQRTPPELSADILRDGMVVTGGGALLRGICEYFTRVIGIPARCADDPVTCVARGSGIALEKLDLLGNAIFSLPPPEYSRTR